MSGGEWIPEKAEERENKMKSCLHLSDKDAGSMPGSVAEASYKNNEERIAPLASFKDVPASAAGSIPATGTYVGVAQLARA